jgi:hypothetical protein
MTFFPETFQPNFTGFFHVYYMAHPSRSSSFKYPNDDGDDYDDDNQRTVQTMNSSTPAGSLLLPNGLNLRLFQSAFSV